MLVDGVHRDQRDFPFLACCYIRCCRSVCFSAKCCCVDNGYACISYFSAKRLAADCCNCCLYAFITHNVRILCHCAKQETIFNQVLDCIRLIKAYADNILAGCLDSVSCTSCRTFVTSEDTNNALCNVVLCNTLGFCCITFAVLCFQKVVVASIKCAAEAFLTCYAGICCCVYVYDSDVTGGNACCLKCLNHFFACCLTCCLVVCREGCLCIYVCRRVNIYNLNTLAGCVLQCGRDCIRSVCCYHDSVISTCCRIVYTFNLLCVVFGVRGHEVYHNAKFLCCLLCTFI